MALFSKILIANRGEIACRVIKTAHEMGYETVAVYSEADKDALHVKLASEAICIGPAAASESYLKIENILNAARQTGADAIHPGYGFLSENAEFADACSQNGLTFIGPSSNAITLMGNKAEAKRRMIEADVPCVPGYEGHDQSDSNFVQAAAGIGFPVMVKAAAGGGGRGMRLVAQPEKLEKALSAARSEAENAFGSGELIIEKAVVEPRHIEIQVFADNHGNVVHLGERDCSIQRRHQKVIEEAPSPAVSETLRSEMGAAAVAAAKAINYSGAGTVEFLLASDNAFYFLEMNTRLQVEHPVTELITGFDLVEWQLRVARGEVLPVSQSEISLNGHAMEARLYAEDPYKNFLPKVGTLIKWETSEGPGRRCDHGLEDGSVVSPHYDAMIAKVIAYGRTREDARRRLISSLKETLDLGLTTNKQFLIDCLSHENFANGDATTGFIETNFPKKSRTRPAPTSAALRIATALHFARSQHNSVSETDGWKSSAFAASPLILEVNDEKKSFSIEQSDFNQYQISSEGSLNEVTLLDVSSSSVRVEIDGHQMSANYAFDDADLYLAAGPCQFKSQEVTLAPASSGEAAGDGRVLAPMNGRVIDVKVIAGQTVKRGQTLATLEAMKMEHDIVAKIDGIVAKVSAAADDQVATRAVLVEIDPA